MSLLFDKPRAKAGLDEITELLMYRAAHFLSLKVPSTCTVSFSFSKVQSFLSQQMRFDTLLWTFEEMKNLISRLTIDYTD